MVVAATCFGDGKNKTVRGWKRLESALQWNTVEEIIFNVLENTIWNPAFNPIENLLQKVNIVQKGALL